MTILRPADLRGLAALLGSQEPHAVVPPCWHWGLLLDPVIPGNLDENGYVIGSPKYMAPEQILGKKVDEAADIYSIGVIMYEMVTGIPPYSRGDHMSVMYQNVQGKAKTCQEVNPEIPDSLAAVIGKSMSVDKTKRYQSMDDLMDALNEIEL